MDGNTDEYMTMVMGESCPEEDIIEENCWLPKLDIGDWLVFEGKRETKYKITRIKLSIFYLRVIVANILIILNE